jgi:hypothetical protein
MSGYEFTGTVVHIGEIQHFGDKGFYKAELVLCDNADKFPQEVPFECIKGAADNARAFQKGDNVTVSFDLRGRYWEKGDKWFPSLNAWRVEKVGSKPAPKKASDPGQGDLPPLDSEDDDLSMPPF